MKAGALNVPFDLNCMVGMWEAAQPLAAAALGAVGYVTLMRRKRTAS